MTTTFLGNSIYNLSKNAAIVGGRLNRIGNSGSSGTFLPSHFSFIGGGENNCIDTALVSAGTHISHHQFIGGGQSNTICYHTTHSAILGGQNNVNAAYISSIGGGKTNVIDFGANLGFIGGGYENRIAADSLYSVIGGGQFNCICAGYLHSSIGGGYKNCVLGHCSSILGGFNNYTASDYSVILGGSGNSIPAGFPYAGVFGCNVTALNTCAFHANQFVSQNMCNMTGAGIPPPTGTLYYCVTGVGQCTVYIS